MPVDKSSKDCVGQEMRRFKSGDLHSGTGKEGKKGGVVKDRKQAIAIALSVCGKSKKEYSEKIQSLGYTEETAQAITNLLYGETNWNDQFKTGKTGPTEKGNFSPPNELDVEATLTGAGGKRSSKIPSYMKTSGEEGQRSISGPALERGPGNPQGGSSKEVQGLRMLG
jgi:hypothetical protein